MKSLKTLIISAAVCGAMALPLSSLASHCSCGKHKAGKGDLDGAIKTVMTECKMKINAEKCKKLKVELNKHSYGEDSGKKM